MEDIIGNLFIPFMILFLAITFILVIKFISSRYKKIPPNAVGVFYGRKYKHTVGEGADQKTLIRGFDVVTGGGRILMPFVESYQEMTTLPFQVGISEDNIPNKDNVKFKVKGVASCKISNEPQDVVNAAQKFLGKNEQEINLFVLNILKGHLRSIIGKSSIESLLRERDEFNQKVRQESAAELKNLGIEILSLVIQDIDDEYGYINSLGKKAVALAKRDADISVAEAEKESAIKVSNAKKESEIVKAQNDTLVAEAEKERDVKKADYKVEADTKKAKADTALNIALADQQKTLKVKEAERDAAERESQVIVEEKEALRMEKHLYATVIKPAEAAKKKTILEAEASNESTILAAQASNKRVILDAEAEQKKATMIGEGEASKMKALLSAEAEGEAAKIRQKLLGEAEGTQKMAEALAQMNEAAKLILILDRMPLLLDKGGDAVSKVAESVFKSVAAPFGSIDKISIVDMGGNGSGLQGMGKIVPQTIFNAITALTANGIDIQSLLKKTGIDVDQLLGMIGQETNGKTTVIDAGDADSLEIKN